MNNQENFYEVLGVSEDATLDEIKEAWRRLVKHYHPDRNRSQNASQKTQEINEAWGTLKDAVKRRDYDTRLRQKREARAQEARAQPKEEVEWESGPTAQPEEETEWENSSWAWRTLFYVGVISLGLVIVTVLGSVVRKEASHPPANDTSFVHRGPRQFYTVQSDGRVYLRDRDGTLFSLPEEEAIEYFRSTPGVNFVSDQEIRAHLREKRMKEYAERRSTQAQHMMNSLFDTVAVGLFSHLQYNYQRQIREELNSTATFVGRILGLLVWAIFFGYLCRRLEG